MSSKQFVLHLPCSFMQGEEHVRQVYGFAPPEDGHDIVMHETLLPILLGLKTRIWTALQGSCKSPDKG